MGKKQANSSSPSGPTRAIEALNKARISFTLHEYEHSPEARTYGGETVEKLGVNPATAFKTLMVKLNTDEFVVGIIPVLHHLSMKLIAKAAGAKNAEMADPAVAQRRTGYVVGGISPLGQTTSHRLFVDESCLDHDTMIVSGGRRGYSVELSPLDFIDVSGAECVPLTAID